MNGDWTEGVRPFIAKWKATEWAVFFLFAPLIGFLAMAHPTSVAEFWRDLSTCSLRAAIETSSCGNFVIGILIGGFVCGFLAPAGRGLTNVTFMGAVLACIGIDCIRNPEGHNLIGVEVLMYGGMTTLSVITGLVGSLLRVPFRRR